MATASPTYGATGIVGVVPSSANPPAAQPALSPQDLYNALMGAAGGGGAADYSPQAIAAGLSGQPAAAPVESAAPAADAAPVVDTNPYDIGAILNGTAPVPSSGAPDLGGMLAGTVQPPTPTTATASTSTADPSADQSSPPSPVGGRVRQMIQDAALTRAQSIASDPAHLEAFGGQVPSSASVAAAAAEHAANLLTGASVASPPPAPAVSDTADDRDAADRGAPPANVPTVASGSQAGGQGFDYNVPKEAAPTGPSPLASRLAASGRVNLPVRTYTPVPPPVPPTLVPPPVRDVEAEQRTRLNAMELPALLGAIFGHGYQGTPSAMASAAEGTRAGQDEVYQNTAARAAAQNTTALNQYNDANRVYHNEVLDANGQRRAEEEAARNQATIDAARIRATASGENPMVTKNRIDAAHNAAEVLEALPGMDPPTQQQYIGGLADSGKLKVFGIDGLFPKQADGSYDLGHYAKAVSPNVAAGGAVQANLATMRALYSELSAPNTAPQRVSDIVTEIRGRQAQLGGGVDPLSGPIVSAMTPYEQASIAQRVAADAATQSYQQKMLAQRASEASMRLLTMRGGSDESAAFGSVSHSLSQLAYVNDALARAAAAPPGSDMANQRPLLEASRVAIQTQLNAMGQSRPDIFHKIGVPISAGGPAGRPAGGAPAPGATYTVNGKTFTVVSGGGQ